LPLINTGLQPGDKATMITPNRFNGFRVLEKTAEAVLARVIRFDTRPKPGVNERFIANELEKGRNHTSLRPVMMRSMSLIPMNGTITPPKP
jgi:hypothetical protein